MWKFQELVDSAIDTVKRIVAAREVSVESGLERSLRDMKIALIGRNVARLRKKKLARELIAEQRDPV